MCTVSMIIRNKKVSFLSIFACFQDIKSHTAKMSVEDSSHVVEGLVHHTIKHEHVFEERDLKRQKKLSYELSETVLQSHAITNSDCSLACKLSESSLVAQPKAVSDQHLPKGSVCAFCHTSKITEVSYLLHTILKDKFEHS